jgi:hypothetical protein
VDPLKALINRWFVLTPAGRMQRYESQVGEAEELLSAGADKLIG